MKKAQGVAGDETILAIVEALRGYISARSDEGLSTEALAERWHAEQLLKPEPDAYSQALRLMQKTQRGHERVPRRLF